MLAAFVPWLMLNRDGLTICCILKPAMPIAITPRMRPGSAARCRCALSSLKNRDADD